MPGRQTSSVNVSGSERTVRSVLKFIPGQEVGNMLQYNGFVSDVIAA